MGKILFGALLGAAAVAILAVLITWLAPILATIAVAWVIYRVARHLAVIQSDGLPPIHLRPTQAVDPELDILELTEADIYRPGLIENFSANRY